MVGLIGVVFVSGFWMNLRVLFRIFLIGGMLCFPGGLLAKDEVAQVEDDVDIEFELRMLQADSPDDFMSAEFVGDELLVIHREKEVFRKKLDEVDRRKLLEVLGGALVEHWSGFHISPVFGGTWVRFSGVAGKRELDFSGLSGGPSRLAGLMVVIDEIVGEKVFDGVAWAEETARSKRYESVEAMEVLLLEGAEELRKQSAGE